MKNFFTVLFFGTLLTGIHRSSAETISIDVKNNFFDNDVVNAHVGDVIHWEWVEGSHTTTSDTVPTGAPSWDAPINSTTQVFDYTITIGGHYHYFCKIHGQMMDGVIEASNLTGISPVHSNDNIEINSLSPNSVSIHYQLSSSEKTMIGLYDILANKVAELENGVQQAGDYVKNYSLAGDVKSGVYFLVIESNTIKLTRKISIQ